jgi:hypothetical protein
MVDGDEPYVVGERRLQSVEGHLAVLVVGQHLDLDPTVAGGVQEGDRVAAVLAGRGQDAVARTEVDAVERRVPGAGGVLGDGDLARVRADEPGE